MNHPVSLYAASKKANELMAHTTAISMGCPPLAFAFSLCGPWGRRYGTDVVCQAILAGKPIRVFNHGQMQRDFTYIDDIVEVVRCYASRRRRI